MLDQECEDSLNKAFQLARDMKHEYLTVEHLLLALLDNRSAREALKACGAKFEKLRAQLKTFLESSGQVLNDEEKDTIPTLALQRVLQRAVFHVQSIGKQVVNGANLLVAIFSEQDSQAVYFLKQQNISRLDVVNFLSHGISKDNKTGTIHEEIFSEEKEEDIDTNLKEVREGNRSALDIFGENLNEKMLKRGDPLIARDYEVERVIQTLSRRYKNNPLLVGEPGVGKTAIIEGLARRITQNEVPDHLKGVTIYAIDLPGLVAGTRYRGDFEQRIKMILNEAKNNDKVILFIDEIHMLIGAGGNTGSMDASDIMKPALSRGELRCIGATTYKEYRRIFEKEAPMARRFQKIDVKEPSVEQTEDILKGLLPSFEKHHNVRYSFGAVKAAAELSARYLTDRFLPDKAIDLIDEAGAMMKLKPKKQQTEIGIPEIEEVLAKIANIPAKNISISDKDVIKNLEQNLKMLVFGQDQAIEALVAAIKLARSGLREPNKPWGSFLFTGPTGVGKTEVTQQLANLLHVQLLRFDMSEYMEAHTVARLIGAPPGYVGYGQGGLLTDGVAKHPYSIVLLDEIEKAHPDIFNILLQVMDNGTLTDTNGRTADFRNTTIIMTTNAGAFESSRNAIGFMEQDTSSDGMEALKRLFSPEFRNRLDAIIQFKALDTKIIRFITDKFMDQLQGQLTEKGIVLEITDEAKDWLGKKGYDAKMGARPMARLIQDKIKKPLSDEILFGALSEGGTVRISLDQDQLKFAFEPRISVNKKVEHSTIKM